MGQLLVGAIVLAAVLAAFWLTGRMAPRVAVSPEDWLRSRKPGSNLADLALTVAANVATAMILGGTLALHLWPEAVLYALNLGALVALLIFQIAAIEDAVDGILPKSSAQGRLNGLLCTIYGLGLLTSKTPTNSIELFLLLLLALSLLVRLREERRAPPSRASSSA